MQSAHVKPSCPTCNRHFDKNSEVEDLKKELEKDIKKIPGKVHSIQNKLQRAIERQEKLQTLLPEKKQTDEMKVEVEAKRRAIVDIEKNLKTLEEEVGTVIA